MFRLLDDFQSFLTVQKRKLVFTYMDVYVVIEIKILKYICNHKFLF